MKNWLSYYYNINGVDIHQSKSGYFFEKDGFDFIFFEYFMDIDNLKNIYEFSEELFRYGIYCHKIILNKDRQIFTNINGKIYILLKCYKGLERKNTFSDVLLFLNRYVPNEKLRCDDWKKLWKRKLDYFEYQLSQFGNSHILLRNSFNYFSGYVETAIMMLDNIHIENKNLNLSHRRVGIDTKMYDLYNPFNLVIDFKSRDSAEFFKSQFLKSKNIKSLIFDITTFLNGVDFDSNDYQMFFIRMLYPTFYFDLFESIINNNGVDDLMLPIIGKVDDYKNLIIFLYRYISKYVELPRIEWLQ